MTRWTRALLLLMLSVTLTAAPCAHCLTQPAAEAEPGHDCCPKQKQGSEEPECTWMPAQYAAPEGLTPGVELAVVALLPVSLGAGPSLPPIETLRFDEALPPASPPLYLTNASLLI